MISLTSIRASVPDLKKSSKTADSFSVEKTVNVELQIINHSIDNFVFYENSKVIQDHKFIILVSKAKQKPKGKELFTLSEFYKKDNKPTKNENHFKSENYRKPRDSFRV